MKIALERVDVVIPWESRQILLARIRPRESNREVVEAFEAVGAASPVHLSGTAKAVLLAELEHWLNTTLPDEIPAGIRELRDELATELAPEL